MDSKIPNFKANSAKAHGENCYGCKATHTDVMVTFGAPQPYSGANEPMGDCEPLRLVDVFLDRVAAEQLYQDLGVALGKARR